MSVAVAEPSTSQDVAQQVAESTTVNADGSALQIVSFKLANEEYGVDIMRAQEIIMPGAITRMPEVPDFVCGLINLRGHVIPVVDLRKRFGLATTENDEHTRIIVVNVATKTIGMVVDEVTEVLRIDATQIDPPPSSITGIDQDYVRGIVKREDTLLILLNIENILSGEVQDSLVRAG